jgi:hypothetical protein
MAQSDIIWAGTITSVSRTEELFDDAPGSVTAMELGACLDDKSPGGWAFIGDRTQVPPPVAINETAATWNLPPLAYGTDLARTQAQPNLILHPDQDTYPGLKIFYSDMLDLASEGTLLRGTKADLIRHVFAFGRPAAWPELNLVLAPGTTDIIDSLDRNVEVVDPNGLTFRGLLDIVFPRAGGLAWMVTIEKAGRIYPMKWRVTVVRTDAAETTLTVNITSPVISLRSQDIAPAYDAVEVVGAPIVCCGTIPFRQATGGETYNDFVMGTKGWTAEAETKFVTAELSQLDTLRTFQPALYDEALSTFRSQGSMARVYRAFRPNLFGGVMWAGDCSRIGVSERTGSRPENIENTDLRSPLFPTVHFALGSAPTVYAPPSLEGKTTTVEFLAEDNYAFAPPSPVVLRMLPWIPIKVGAVAGLEYQQVASEQLMKPQLHYHRGAGSAEDLTLVKGIDEKERAGVGMSPDTVTESVILSTSPPDFFAFDQNGMRVSEYGTYRRYENQEPEPVDAYSWQNMLLTAAYPHQQRLRVLFYRDGRTDPEANAEDWIDYGWMPPALRAEGEKNNNVIRKLVIQEDRLQAWYVAPGTILTMRYNQEDGGPSISDSPFTTTPYNTHTWTRNDYDAAHAYAMRLARRYFKDQAAYSIEVPRPDQMLEADGGLTHVLPGMWIGDLVLTDPDSATGRNKTISALVESVSRDFATGRMLIKTAAPMTPVFYNNGTISPSLGGPVSPSLGGTMAQAVGKLQSTVREMQTAQASAAPVVPATPKPGGGGGGTGLIMARILGGNASSGTGSDSPLGRLFVHSVNYTKDGALLETPPVPDWANLDLGPDFVIGGSKIPLQPTGIGFAQILRPYSLGSAKWSSNASWIVLSSTGGPVMNVANINPDKKTITLTGNKTDIAKTATPNITVTVDGVAATIQAIAATASGAKIVLQAVADITKPIVVTWDGSAFIQGEVPVPAGSLTVTPVGDYYTIVRVLNNTGSQGFSFGSYVMLDQAATSVTDDKAVSKTCYRIIGPASQAVPHNHSGLGATGQGRVVFVA